jgi:hypothetical protein
MSEPQRDGERPRRLPGEPLPPPDPRRQAPRVAVAGLIGAEAGAAVGLIGFGGRVLAPLAFAVAGAAAGPVIVAGAGAAKRRLFRRAVRRQLRSAARG